MDLQGLSAICAGLGTVDDDDNGERIGYTKSEYCLDNLKDLQRFLRRDDPQTRDVFKQVSKWNIVGKDLVPIIEHYQDDKVLVISAVKVLVFLSMPIEPTSNDISQQIDHLWELKASLTRNDTIAVIISLLESPLENLECEAFSEDDWKLVQLVLTLFRNILAIQDVSLQQKASGCATQYLSLRDRFLELMFNENVMDLILALTQHVGGSHEYLRQDNLLFLEIFNYIFIGQDPDLIVKASMKKTKGDEDVKESVSFLRSMMDEEKDKRRLARLRNLDRHSQFSGTFTRLSMDGSKSLLKGNPCTARDRLLKPPTIHRGPMKRIVGDHSRLASSKEKILERLYDFINQFLLGGYNELMQSVRKDIEKEHPAIQNNDIIIFFQVAEFITSLQRQKFILLKKPQAETDTPGVFVDKYADSTLFQGDICGPVAATMNEAMFLLVISKWRNAFDGLKETKDFKSLSAAGSLMKNMIRMLDLVLKLLPDDSKEPQTARILLYKIFYDQTDQGLTQFLITLIKTFDIHKQPKSDLADLVEMIHVVVRLMEDLQERGTLRVSKKSKRGRKKKAPDNVNATGGEELGIKPNSQHDDASNLSVEEPKKSSMTPEELLENPRSDQKEDNVSVLNQTDGLGIPATDTGDLGDGSAHTKNQDYSHNPETENPVSQNPDIQVIGTDDSSEDDLPPVTNEVDFKVSSFVSTFANNTIIQNLCWLLKFYKSNSISTNHYIICMFRRICDDLELSPMLYQLSLVTTFYDILAEQKSANCKEYANIVSFLSNLVRKMMKKMKSQPLLFIEVLFWKTRRECHYINSETMGNKLGELKKQTSTWQTGDHEQIVSSQDNGRTNKSIADSLGDDEADVPISEPQPTSNYNDEENLHGAERQKVTHMDTSDEMRESISNFVDGGGNSNSDDADNEGSSVEHKSNQDQRRKRRLVFDQELETDTKNTHEKERSTVEHKSHQDAKRKKKLVFDQELETDIKDLYEKFKDQKRWSHDIANALLNTGRTLTAAQVSRKVKQLGLYIPKKTRLSGSRKHARNINGKNLDLNEGEESEDETLLTLKKRSKTNKSSSSLSGKPTSDRLSQKINSNSEGDDSDDELLSSLIGSKTNKRSSSLSGKPTSDSLNQKINSKSEGDDSDDELLSSLVVKTGKKTPSSRVPVDKVTPSSIAEMTTETDQATQVFKDAMERNGPSEPTETSLQNDNVNMNRADMENGTSLDQISSMKSSRESGVVPSSNEGNREDQEMPDELADELEDSEDDAMPVAPSSTIRRKLKMVIDLEDDE